MAWARRAGLNRPPVPSLGSPGENESEVPSWRGTGGWASTTRRRAATDREESPPPRGPALSSRGPGFGTIPSDLLPGNIFPPIHEAHSP